MSYWEDMVKEGKKKTSSRSAHGGESELGPKPALRQREENESTKPPVEQESTLPVPEEPKLSVALPDGRKVELDQKTASAYGISTDGGRIDAFEVRILPGENILWQSPIERGWINKHRVADITVTNFRFYVYRYEDDDRNPVNRITAQVPIQDCEAIALNVRRYSSGTGLRTYGYGTSIGSWNGASQSVGTVDFFAKSTGARVFTLTDVPDPHGLVRLVKSAQKNLKEGLRQRSPPPPPKKVQSDTSSLGTQLSRLAGLAEKGMITQEEFQKAKKKLLE